MSSSSDEKAEAHDVMRSFRRDAAKRLRSPTGRKTPILPYDCDWIFLVKVLRRCEQEVERIENLERACLSDRDIKDLERIMDNLKGRIETDVCKVGQRALGRPPDKCNSAAHFYLEIEDFLKAQNTLTETIIPSKAYGLSKVQFLLRIFLTAYWEFYLGERTFKAGGGTYQRFIIEMQGRVLSSNQLNKDKLRSWLKIYWHNVNNEKIRNYGKTQIEHLKDELFQ